MALKFSTALRNALLDAIEATIGASPVLKVLDGTIPATLGDALTGNVLASITCPVDWMASASGGSKAKSGTWQDAAADAGGTPTHFSLESSGGTRHIQGTAGVGSGDLSFDNAISLGGTVTISAFALTAGNADS